MFSTLVPKIILIILLAQSTANNHLNSYNGTRYTDNSEMIGNPVNKVNVSFYYETLCPASRYYLSVYLGPATEKLGRYLQVKLIPYGHAKTEIVDHRPTFTCQHGPSECLGNRLHACVIHVLKNSTKSTLFNACLVEGEVQEKDIELKLSLVNCSVKFGVATYAQQIWHCTIGLQGEYLHSNYGKETHLLPRLDYVPLVLVDGGVVKPSRNLMLVVCEKLKPAPAACQGRRR